MRGLKRKLKRKIVQQKIGKINKKVSRVKENCDICADFFLKAFYTPFGIGIYSDRDRAQSFNYIQYFASKLNKLYDQRNKLGEQYLQLI